MLIVLTGIDGSGKSTAARALVDAAGADGENALLLSNHAGRRSMAVLGERLGIRWPRRLADAVETTLRVANVLVSHARASRFDGLVVMDRHLHCQLALRAANGLRRGGLLPWLPADRGCGQAQADRERGHCRGRLGSGQARIPLPSAQAQISACRPLLRGRPKDAAPRNSIATNGSEPTTHSSCPGGNA